MHTERETIEHIIERQFGCSADEIGAIENVTNNYVYPFTAAGKQYFLKLWSYLAYNLFHSGHKFHRLYQQYLLK